MPEKCCLPCGGNTLAERYTVKIYAKAYHDLDHISAHIAENLKEPAVAEKMMDVLEEAIYSLEELPERGAVRRTGTYANQGYRQLVVKNYLIIYRVWQEKKEVHIVTIRHGASQF